MGFSFLKNPLRCRWLPDVFLPSAANFGEGIVMPPCRYVAMFSCRHVAMPACRHDGMSAYVPCLSSILAVSTDLLTGMKALNMTHITHWYIALIRAQLVQQTHNKRQRKEEVRAEPMLLVFPLHRPLGVVGILLRVYFTIYQHFIIYIQQFNRILQTL